MHLKRITSHVLGAALEGALVAVLITGLVAGVALAGKGNGGKGGGKPGSGGTGTIAMVMVDDANGNGGPNWADVVTFNISTTATDQPWVHLKCYQGGALVAEGWNGYFEGSLTGRDFGLYSPAWTAGSADCTADLTTPTWAVLGTTSFHVDA